MLPSVILVLSSVLIITSSYLFLLYALTLIIGTIYSIVFFRVKSTSFEDYKRFGLNKILSYITNAAPYNQ